MTGNVSCEKKLGIMSDKCHINLNNESSIPPTSEKVTKSTGRKSFCKRRSSCFDSLVNSGFGNSTNTEGRLGDVGTTNTSAEELMEKLKSEKQAWRSLYEERKQKYRTVKKYLNSEPLKLDWNNCADVLPDEDKQFLSDRPDYEKIVSKMNHVCEMASICMHMKHKSAHTSNKIIGIAEQQVAAIKKKIFKHAEAYYT
ncbi:uncharacterized protein LOC111868887 isoform X2 [Cryptotermes secundus]|uniref:uncharacterized protein LOC111868887 isoform X2 n=1 Tax=Cryptotermes secundus TaxID=105785 RepID=UPI000CD7CF0A|nr:uncharacterized protein LOC111868887 isoform X2 [Cryptotermes secundus]